MSGSRYAAMFCSPKFRSGGRSLSRQRLIMGYASPSRKGEFLGARGFQLQRTPRENIVELRRALGAIHKPLSLRALAELVNAAHPTKTIDFKTVDRWTRAEDPVEPDLVSIVIMAGLAGVSFEEFALGKGATMRTVAEGAGVQIQVAEPAPPTADGELVAKPGPRTREAARPTKQQKGRR
jgi:hypothetical protein